MCQMRIEWVIHSEISYECFLRIFTNWGNGNFEFECCISMSGYVRVCPTPVHLFEDSSKPEIIGYSKYAKLDSLSY